MHFREGKQDFQAADWLAIADFCDEMFSGKTSVNNIVSFRSIHKDLTQRLKRQNRALYNSVQKVLQLNKEERHLRGGAATRQKYHPNVE